ncbi:MAG TPA: SCE4755 family polysaccharide monooxygenase-like protein [Polyangiaceae bacterium]|nr:SCE4755 family polysaccharide monooxygenase-like protein [Polyangiaceae bacterium]
MLSRRPAPAALHLSMLGAVALTTLLSARAEAHISLSEPKSRYWNANTQVADQQKQKVGPCGVSGDARSTTASLISTFRPGQRVTVRWTETVQHPGHYRIAFDNDGQDFPVPGTAGMPAGVTILADNIADKGGGSGVAYTQEVTLPTEECARCTLQLIQVMTTAAPPYKASDLYFNCADVILSNGTGGSGGGSGGAAGGSAGSSMGGSATSGSGGMATSGSGGASGGSSGRGGAPSAGAGGSAGAANGGSAGVANGGSASGGQSVGGQSVGGSASLGGSAGQGNASGGSGGSPASAGASAGGSPSGAPSAGAPNNAAGSSSTPPASGDETSSGCALGGAAPESGLGATLLALGAVWLARRRHQRAI